MIQPKLKQVENYSHLVGKKLLLDNGDKYVSNHDSNLRFYTGMLFQVVAVKKTKLTLKLISPQKDCEKSIDDYFVRMAKSYKRDINTFDKIIKIWQEEKDQFVPDKEDYSYKNGGHCINTGYHDIPKDHPDKGGFSDDTIKTYDYIHKGGRTNLFSYQAKRNVWYNQACYEFMRLADIEKMKKYDNPNSKAKKIAYNRLCKKVTFEVATLNKANFRQVK